MRSLNSIASSWMNAHHAREGHMHMSEREGFANGIRRILLPAHFIFSMRLVMWRPQQAR
jgi:hypothetical protein